MSEVEVNLFVDISEVVELSDETVVDVDSMDVDEEAETVDLVAVTVEEDKTVVEGEVVHVELPDVDEDGKTVERDVFVEAVAVVVVVLVDPVVVLACFAIPLDLNSRPRCDVLSKITQRRPVLGFIIK